MKPQAIALARTESTASDTVTPTSDIVDLDDEEKAIIAGEEVS